MKIPVAKPYLTKDEAKAAYETILSGWVTQGPNVEEFERKFAKYAGSKYAVAVSSCTAALHLSMIVAGIKPGDEVICPSMSFIATANAIRYVGAKPVFAEVDPQTYNIDVMHAARLITPKTKAILIVHQVGLPADINAFKILCRRHKLKLIEDAACAAGSSYKGKKIGSHSDLVCFSFHPRKVITTGDGGMVTTSSKRYYERLKRLRQHGMSISDRARHAARKIVFEDYLELGFNYRMTDIQAAVGIKQLEKLDWLVRERQKIARKYCEALADLDCLQMPSEIPGYISNLQSYLVYLKKNAPISRDNLMQKMLDKDIVTRRGIMTAHRTKSYREYAKVSLPVSEDLSDRSLIIPLYVPMTNTEINYVIKTIRTLLQKF
jgi:dTDP-4-amino-4,6-dideoxygalactose transaminase